MNFITESSFENSNASKCTQNFIKSKFLNLKKKKKPIKWQKLDKFHKKFTETY